MDMTTDIANFTNEEILYDLNMEHRTVLMPVIILFGLEVAFGIVGNILTLYVFYFHYKESNFRYFVLCLALVDLTSCLTTIPGSMVTQMFWFNYPVPCICKAKDYFNTFTAYSEAALLTAIAVERYRKVCKPLHWQIKRNQAKYICVGIYFFSACFAIETPFFWGIHTRTIIFRDRNITVTLCEKDDKYLDTAYAQATTILKGCFICLSLVIMFILYILIVQQLVSTRRALSRGKRVKTRKGPTNILSVCLRSKPNSMNDFDLAESQRHDNRIDHSKSNENRSKFDTAMPGRPRRKNMIGLILSVIFIFTIIIYCLLISIVATGILETFNNRQKATYTFFLRLYFINHVINPVLYVLMDTQFRAEMLSLKDVVSKRCVFVCSKEEEEV